MIIDDLSGRVLEQWTGFQVAWTMARGYPGAFGRHVNALYIWLPLCVLFLLPFLNFRRPLKCCTSTCSCCCPSRSRWRSSTTARSTRRCRWSTRRCCTCSRACSRWHDRGRAARSGAAAPARARAVARARRRLPDRLSRRAERDRLERDRRRLRRRDRRAAGRPRQAALRSLAERQRTRRHLRPGQLRGVRAVRAGVRLERHAGTTCRRRTPRRSSSTCWRSRCCS